MSFVLRYFFNHKARLQQILKEIRVSYNQTNREEKAENIRPGPSNLESKRLGKNTSNKDINKDESQYILFQSSEMDNLRHPTTPFGVANEVLYDSVFHNY